MPDNSSDIAKSFFDKFSEGLKTVIPELKDFSDGIENMIAGAEKVSTQFGIGRTRMVELMGAITEATPAIDRLGGNLKDVEQTMNAVAKATNRNVVAGTEDISKLFAAQQALGLETESTVEKFQEVGVNFSKVGEQLETSMNYIQSVGGNASDIMRTMLQDLSAMNKYNFQNGVEGFTKMATQAAMLKVDMRETLNLAEKALDPDGAIELASAFQRLGVSVGELTDPFQLMNMSLNDPEGLQNSIVEMSKQFTVFDEKTKTFKINPQGMLMMREIGKQTGLNASELSKMALNASELDRKLSQISPSINFTKEEDRQLLANIATMNADGKYEIAYGEDDKIELEKLTQEQVDELIKQQGKAPKTLEELQRSQMDAITLMKSDLREIKDKIVYGVVSAPMVRRESEGARQALTSATGAVAEVTPSVKAVRDAAEGSIDKIKDLISTMKKEGTFGPESMKLIQSELNKLDDLGKKGDEKVQSAIDIFLKNNANNTSEVGKMFQKLLTDEVKGDDKKTTTKMTSTGVGAGAEHIGTVMKETNLTIASKMDESNKLTKEGNDKLGTISDGLNKKPSTTQDGLQVKGILSEELLTTFNKSNDLQTDNNNKLATLTETMKNFKPTDNTNVGMNKGFSYMMGKTKDAQTNFQPTTFTSLLKNFPQSKQPDEQNILDKNLSVNSTQPNITDQNLESVLKPFLEEFKKLTDIDPKKLPSLSINPLDNSTMSNQNPTVPNITPIDSKNLAKLDQVSTMNTNTNTTTTSTKEVSFGGTVTFKIDAPPGVSTQYLTEYVNSRTFGEEIYKIWKEKNNELKGKV